MTRQSSTPSCYLSCIHVLVAMLLFMSHSGYIIISDTSDMLGAGNKPRQTTPSQSHGYFLTSRFRSVKSYRLVVIVHHVIGSHVLPGVGSNPDAPIKWLTWPIINMHSRINNSAASPCGQRRKIGADMGKGLLLRRTL